jgi:hypothetical protein
MIRIDAILLTAALVSNTLEQLKVHVFDGPEDAATKLDGLGVVGNHAALRIV